MECSFETLEVYQLSEKFSDKVWDDVMQWQHFEKSTLGRQLVNAADSVPSNISEGYGRYTFKDSKSFYIIARGSLNETKSILRRCKNRGLINAEIVDTYLKDIEEIKNKLQAYINWVAKNQEKFSNVKTNNKK